MRRLLLLGAALAALLLAACGGDEEARPVTLMLNWTPNNHHAGIYAALQQGWYEEEGIELTIIEPAPAGADAVVGAGTAHFGISQAESLLPARLGGADVVSIAALLPYNDSSLMALAEEGITRPRDLEGKTYGGWGGLLEQELLDTLVAWRRRRPLADRVRRGGQHRLPRRDGSGPLRLRLGVRGLGRAARQPA